MKLSRGVQLGPWYSESISVCGAPTMAAMRSASVVLPEPDVPATRIRRGAETKGSWAVSNQRHSFSKEGTAASGTWRRCPLARRRTPCNVARSASETSPNWANRVSAVCISPLCARRGQLGQVRLDRVLADGPRGRESIIISVCPRSLHASPEGGPLTLSVGLADLASLPWCSPRPRSSISPVSVWVV